MKNHDVEVVAADDVGLHFAGFTQANHGETNGGKIADGAEGFDAGAQILDFGNGERGVALIGSRGAQADVDQAVLVTIDERLEEHAAHQGKDGGMGTDAQCQRQNDCEGSPLARERSGTRCPHR